MRLPMTDSIQPSRPKWTSFSGATICSRPRTERPIAAILFPISHGMVYFVGFTVIEPFLVRAPARISINQRGPELPHSP